jgi:hypothetical protein
MVKLAASCDIDAECRRRAAAPPAAGASAAPADLPRLVDEVSSCIALLRRDSPNNMPMLPDTALVQTLLALSTRAPNLFRLPQLTNALLYFMERSAPAAAAPLAANTPAASLPPTPLGGLKKKSPQLAVMAVTILDAAYRTLPPTQTWPLSFVRVLLEDYFDMRNWIDHDAAKGFIATITHSFKNWTPAPAAAEAMDESEGEEEITVEDSSDAIMTDAPSVAVSGSSSTAAVGSSSTAAVGSASTAAAAAAASATPRPAIAVPSSAMPMIPLGAAGRASSLGASSLLRSISSAAASKDLKQPVIPRYETQALSEEIRLMVERAFAVAIKANFSTGSRTGTNPMPAHLLRFLSISLGYRSLRHFTLLNLDAWLTHSSSNKGGKKLLVLVADELHKAAVLPHNIAAFDQVNVLNIPAKSLWNDLGANASTFTPETLHAWTRTTAPPAVPIDLQSIRLFMQVGMKVKSTMGGSQTASNSQWDQTYLQALTRLFRGPTHEPFSLPSATAVGTAVCIEAPSPCLLPASAWKAAFHSWIAQDWSHAASAAGWSQGVNQQPGHAPPAPAINTPALLYAPSHFILRVLDTFLVNPPSGGLLPVLSSYMLTILDKADYMHRMHLVLRRAMWLNTMYAYSNENISSLQSAGTAPTTVLDLFSLARRLLDWSLYDSVQNSALRAVKEPVLTDEQGRPVAATEAPAAVLQAHMAEVAKYHSRRETIITELLNVITWCCLLTSQPVVLLQSLSSGSISGGGPSFISKPASDGSADGARILPSQHIAAAESALQTWRFSAAFTQAKAMAWIQEWLVGFLDAPSNATVQPAEANAAPTYKDAAILFSDALTSLLFLHSSVQQFLLPFIGAPAPLSLISTPTSKSTPSSSSSSSSSGFFLADIWTLDQAFLKKSASALLLDKLPLLEDTITRLVMISIANPARLPHAHTIQILEILLRRVCQLALSVGKKYESTESDGPGILRIQNDGLLESILQLSQFPTPVPPPAPPGQTHPPLLAQSALFWRSCVLLVIASAFNPHTIGRRSWEQVPTLRCLLEMVVSEIWLQYPSSGGAPSQPASLSALYPPFPDLISKSLLNHKVGAEIDAILFVENLLPDNRPGAGPGGKGVPRTRETSLYLSHGYLMLLDPSEILRRPPEHILQTIQKLVSDFQLGTLHKTRAKPTGRSSFADIFASSVLFIRRDAAFQHEPELSHEHAQSSDSGALREMDSQSYPRRSVHDGDHADSRARRADDLRDGEDAVSVDAECAQRSSTDAGTVAGR